MRNVFISTCAAIVLMAGALIGWTNAHAPKSAPEPAKVKTQFVMEKLANGDMVYKEVPVTGELPEIEPAAGGDDQRSDKSPRYKYDPLTQTYRKTLPDGSQEIIRDPLNPSKN